MRRVLVALLLLVAACGGEGRVRVLSPDELPADLYASPSPEPTAAPAQNVDVWFVRDEGIVAATRRVTGTGSLAEFALRAVLAGPTRREAAEGLTTAIPDGAELLEVTLSDGVATVNLSKEFESGAEQNVLLLRLGQVVYTVTSLAEVSRVRFLIDSESASVIGEDGAPHEEVGRTDYSGLVAPRTTPAPTG